MTKLIDKDISLFLPKKYNFLLLGGNFLLAKRLYEITKRQFEIKRIDYDFSSDETYVEYIGSHTPKILLEPAKKIRTLIDLYKSNVLVLTSEIFLFLDEETYKDFLEVIKEVKTTNLRIIFISVNNPLHVYKNINNNWELSNMFSKTWYKSRIETLIALLNPNIDLIFNCGSYVTYVESNLHPNVIDLLKSNTTLTLKREDESCVFSLDIGDNIIDNLIANINRVGIFDYNNLSQESLTLGQDLNLLEFNNKFSYAKTQTNCSVNLIYRKKPSEQVFESTVARIRYELGYALSEQIPINVMQELDIIVPVPETGKYYAQGLSSALGIPYTEAFFKKAELGRSFDITDLAKRTNFLNNKLGIIEDFVKHKTVGIVDEAIFTGQTLTVVRKLLENTQVNKIYFFIASPPCVRNCNFNMLPDRSLLCAQYTLNQIISFFRVDGIYYQHKQAYDTITKSSGFTCTKCFK